MKIFIDVVVFLIFMVCETRLSEMKAFDHLQAMFNASGVTNNFPQTENSRSLRMWLEMNCKHRA